VASAVAPPTPLAAARPDALPSASVTHPVAVPTAHQQVAGAIAALRTGGDGTHHIVLQLHPDDLGPVSIVARLNHGELTVSLTSGTDAARAALHEGMNQLRDDLRQAGFSTVAVSVDAGGAGDARRGSDETGAQRSTSSRSERTDPAAPPRGSVLNRSREGVDRWL
jgi:flagellar hook-length control protein FliK